MRAAEGLLQIRFLKSGDFQRHWLNTLGGAVKGKAWEAFKLIR